MSAPFEAFGLRHEVALGWMSIDNHSDIQRYAMVGPAPAIGSFFDWRRAHIQEPSWADTLSPADDVRTKQTGAYLVGRFALAEPLHLIVGDRWSDWKTKQMYFWLAPRIQDQESVHPLCRSDLRHQRHLHGVRQLYGDLPAAERARHQRRHSSSHQKQEL